MILKKRPFSRKEPDKDAIRIFIFCEGVKREYQYFQYFREMDSRINIEIYGLSSRENNSPLGLLNIAQKHIIKSEGNKEPKYDFQEHDEVWIVVDRDLDKRDSRVQLLKNFGKKKSGVHPREPIF